MNALLMNVTVNKTAGLTGKLRLRKYHLLYPTP
jgi:hypothetical protein